jgi:hypothetical protein
VPTWCKRRKIDLTGTRTGWRGSCRRCESIGAGLVRAGRARLQLPDQWREFRRGQFRRLLGGRVGREAAHRFGEVALGIDPLDPAVRNQGIDQRTARSGLGTAEKQVVLQAELRRANQILGKVVCYGSVLEFRISHDPAAGRLAAVVNADGKEQRKRQTEPRLKVAS